MPQLTRCPWVSTHEIDIVYHDSEWGVPCWSDDVQFEFLVLESAQAGLSWHTILNKRENYRKAFAGFDAAKVARFGPAKVQKLMDNPGIIRNIKKVEAAINNARCFLEVQAKHGSFCNYLWGFVDGRPIKNAWKKKEQVPAQTELSQKISQEMKKLGFKFLGPVVLYSHLQATGLINDHLISCHRYDQVESEKYGNITCGA